MTKEFASIAEAVAFYFNDGYTTVGSTELSRIMVKRARGSKKLLGEVIINKVDFLSVVAEETRVA